MSGTSTATTTQNASPPIETTAVVVPEDSLEILTPELYGIFASLFVLVLTVFVLFSTGSILAVMVLWATIALMLTVLSYYGFLNLDRVRKEVKPLVPAAVPITGAPLVGSEVFNVSENQFTYDEAPAVCAAYGAQLATLEQIIEAYNSGAEWCSYGWSAGGMALYPTQKKTWVELQREVDPGKRTACGRPGVNGGYFDPSLKFGVNCFGFKPPGEFTPPAPVPGTDKRAFDEMVARFREMLKTLNLAPFSRNEWSGYDSTPVKQAINLSKKITEGFVGRSAGYGGQFKQDLGKLVETFEAADPAYIEAANTVEGYNPNGPFGLRGDLGPPGPEGPPGPVGPGGPKGMDGVRGGVGPQGAQGPKGDTGRDGAAAAAGATGPRGLQGPEGPRGLQGLQGIAGIAAAAGAKGDVGPAGATGPAGAVGPAGRDGAPGPGGARGDVGPAGPAGPGGPAELIAPLVRNGTIKNLTRCQLNNEVIRIVATFRSADDPNGVLTRDKLCRSFYNQSAYVPFPIFGPAAEASSTLIDTRRPEFKPT